MRDLLSILTLPFAPLRWLLNRLRVWIRDKAWEFMHDKSEHNGILLLRHFKAPKGSMSATREALDRIAEVDPVSFAKIPRLLPGGIIADATGYSAAWYSVRRKACVIGAKTLETYDTDDIALSIVHELCHARLFAAGFGYDGAKFRVRIEKICVRREIAFARKLEARDVETGFYTEWLNEKVKGIVPENYTEESFQKRHRREHLQKLRLLKRVNAPACLRRRIVLKTRRRFQRQRQLAEIPAEQPKDVRTKLQNPAAPSLTTRLTHRSPP